MKNKIGKIIPIIGLETEYALVLEGNPAVDPARACQMFYNFWKSDTHVVWDYDSETPSQDARGWVGLRSSTTIDQNAYTSDSNYQRHNEKQNNQIIIIDPTNLNSMLLNGARFYIDHAHPEYSTPECSSLMDLISSDIAGQRFMMDAAQSASKYLPADQRFLIYRNNIDYHGESWGCHENYLMDLECYAGLFGNFQHRIFTFLIPFLVTRQIICGAGRVGSEDGDKVDYQISQRADFIETLVGVQTVFNRPIVNTRDEPLADTSKYRRLHVIVGDANMSEYSTYLKVGTTRLVLEMLQSGWTPFDLTLTDPVKGVKAVSRDLTCQQRVLHAERRAKPYSALEIQFKYLKAARKYLDTHHISTGDNEAVWLLWHDTLLKLAEDQNLLGTRLDWIIKLNMLRGQISKMELNWKDPKVKGLDIKYHDVAIDRSVYHRLLERGRIERLVSNDDIERFLMSPPPDTRAYFRSKLLAAFGSHVLSVNWDRIKILNSDKSRLMRIQMPDPIKNCADILQEIGQDPFSIATILNRDDVIVSKESIYATEETNSGSNSRTTAQSDHD